MTTQPQSSLPSALAEFYRGMSARRRTHFRFVIVLMLLGALAELVAIGSVVPFLTLLGNPQAIQAMPPMADILALVNADTPAKMITAAAILFCAAAVVAAAIRLQLSWSSQSFIFKLGHEIGVEIHRRILAQPYTYHVGHNTSELLAALDKRQVMVFNVFLQMMQASIAILLAAFIVGILIYIDPFTAIISMASFGVMYVIVSLLTRRRLQRNSIAIREGVKENLQIMQESLGGIRDIIIDGSRGVFVDAFDASDQRLNKARSSNAFIGAAPRFVIEGAGMVLIAVLALIVAARENGISGALPILGAIALGAQRLLPLLQQVYQGWVGVTGNRSAVMDVLDLLRLPLPAEQGHDQSRLNLCDGIRFEAVSFAYPNHGRPVLREVSVNIARGTRVALIGKSGSGKSTLADLLMGLLEPTSGRVMIDNTQLTELERAAWRRSIAHVPQAIFLADTTVAGNIAFGCNEIDYDRVRFAAKQAQLDELIAQLPAGLDTKVGERGVRLSGGQRQRLGIARALYKDAPVVVLDEATSALDGETEFAVMQALEALQDEGRTIVMIAHRLTTIQHCDLVVRLDEGVVTEIGSYNDVVVAHLQKMGS